MATRKRRNRSPAKEFNPSSEVAIVPARDSDGGETFDVVIAPSAMQKLAKAAGVSEAEVSRLNEPLTFMLFELQCQKLNWAPTWTKRIEHLRATEAAACKLETLLSPTWVAAEMRHFESRELKQEIFGTRGLFIAEINSADAQKWSQTGSQRLEGVMRDVEGVARMCARLSTMIKQFDDGTLARGRRRAPPPPGASNPTKQYIADYALKCWSYHLGHGEERTDSFIAFANVLYQLTGFTMFPGAIRAQLTSAVRRCRARTDQRSEHHI